MKAQMVHHALMFASFLKSLWHLCDHGAPPQEMLPDMVSEMVQVRRKFRTSWAEHVFVRLTSLVPRHFGRGPRFRAAVRAVAGENGGGPAKGATIFPATLVGRERGTDLQNFALGKLRVPRRVLWMVCGCWWFFFLFEHPISINNNVFEHLFSRSPCGLLGIDWHDGLKMGRRLVRTEGAEHNGSVLDVVERSRGLRLLAWLRVGPFSW